MAKHVFTNYCVDWAELLSDTNLDRMIDTAHKQSKMEEAKVRVDFANYKDYGADESCPAYFGMWGEWLAGMWLEHFGQIFNIEGVKMLDVEGNSAQDLGVDGFARTIKEPKSNRAFSSTGRAPVQGSPVYIQVKATKNRSKMYEPNDGSRLPNFMTHAQMLAMKGQKAYQARYVLFTTGQGIDYKLEDMTGNLMEVIPYKVISHWMRNNVFFLNKMRDSVGLPLLPVYDSPIDQLAPTIIQHSLILDPYTGEYVKPETVV